MGFEPLLVVENKELNGFLFLTIRQIRTKARVETRIEHADTDAPRRLAALDDFRYWLIREAA